MAKFMTSNSWKNWRVWAVGALVMACMAGCRPTPPEVPLISGKYPSYKFPPIDFRLGSDGQWEVRSSESEFPVPIGDQRFAMHLPVTVSVGEASELPDMILFQLVDPNDVICGSLTMFKSVSDDGTVEYVADGAVGLTSRQKESSSRVRLTSELYLVGGDMDTPCLSLRVRMIDDSQLVGDADSSSR